MKVHLCLADRACWKDWWYYGMPMRLYVGKKFYMPVWPLNTWRHNQIWEDAEPVEIIERPHG